MKSICRKCRERESRDDDGSSTCNRLMECRVWSGYVYLREIGAMGFRAEKLAAMESGKSGVLREANRCCVIRRSDDWTLELYKYALTLLWFVIVNDVDIMDRLMRTLL